VQQNSEYLYFTLCTVLNNELFVVLVNDIYLRTYMATVLHCVSHIIDKYQKSNTIFRKGKPIVRLKFELIVLLTQLFSYKECL
jgi:hypothetical protein